MKKVVSFISTLLFAIQLNAQQDPVLMEIDGQKVTKSEFLQVYLKNNPNPRYDKEALDEYMELFRKFKLKVAEAEALGYDTIPKLKKELDGYKKQLAQPYLVDAAKNEELVKEAYERIKTEVRASHILVRVESTATPADTLAAYERILKLKSRIEAGEDFTAVAKGKNGSDDPSAASNGGDLGYFTAFQMVYSFEDAAYNTAVGAISNPIRTRFGYHIILVKDKRPARGTIKAAHIMVATPKTATPEEISNADKKINELYVKLQNGEKFEDLAKLHSDDPSSSQKGGELPPFGSGTSTRMLPVFEDAAFGLKNNGDFSAPIKTDYGYHILKRIDWNDVKPFNDMKKEIQSKVNRDERSKRTQDSYVETLKKEYGFIDLSNKHLQWFMDNFDSSSVNGKWSSERLKTSFELCNLAGRTYNQKDFSTYLEKNYRGQKGEDKKKTIDTQYANWIKSIVLDYEESKLTSKYPDYKALVQEYHDGILLYEIMTEKVWNKAIKDTMGLKAFFESNRSNYRWPFRIEGTVYECADNTHAKTVFKMLKKKNITSKEIIEKVNEESELNLRVKVNKFDPEQINYLKGRSFVNGRNKPYEFEGKYYVLFVDKNLPAGNKEFSEAKGAATSDYQTYLEKMWLSELEKKHSVKINKEILYSLGQ